MSGTYFTEDAFPIISSILQKNKIEQSDDDFVEKISNNKPIPIEIIIISAEKIFLENASKVAVCSFIKTGLGVSDDLSEKIYSDILAKLIPIVKKRQQITEKKITKSSIDVPEKNIPKKKSPVMGSKKTEEFVSIQQPKGPDTYREPIE